MKTKLVLLAFLALTFLLLSGCDMPEDPFGRYPTYTPEPSLTPSSTATPTPSPTDTPTPIPPTATPTSPDYSRFFFQPIYRPDIGQASVNESAQSIGMPAWTVDLLLYVERIYADESQTYVTFFPVPVGLQFPNQSHFFRCENSVVGPNSISGMRPGEVRQYIIRRDVNAGIVIGSALPQADIQQGFDIWAPLLPAAIAHPNPEVCDANDVCINPNTVLLEGVLVIPSPTSTP